MEIVMKPIVTEKMTGQAESLNRYGFAVDKKATKAEIKKAIEALYDVHVTSINTMIYAGKTKMKFTKTGIQKGSTASYKKAIVTLRDGDIIDFYSNI